MTAGLALVTGAAKRIGREISIHLAKNGWDIIVHYHTSKPEADSLVKEIMALGKNAMALEANLNNELDSQSLFDEIKLKLGSHPNLLINNASLFKDDNIKTISKKSFEDHLTTNLWAPISLIQSFVENGNGGNIVNIIDQRVLKPKPGFLSYGLSKSGLLTLTQVLAQELAPSFRVNAIGPGPILKSIHQTDQDFKSEVDSLPLKTPPNANDICRTISYILETPSMTGQFIALDGGQHFL